MTQIPILSGSFADESAAFRAALPINKEPTFADTGLSKGYLASAQGLAQNGTGPGSGRGGINWNGVCYRVMGSKLCSVSDSGAVTELGYVGDNGLPVTLDYSFDRLAIASNQGLYYYNATEGVTQVTDPDLGIVIDVLFIDGRFMTTDGTSLVITELNDPYAVDPLKYGSAETDPDPLVALCKIRGEVYALGKGTIQNFRNIGGAGFPYQNNAGAMIPRGAVGTKAWSYFLETFYFLGGSRTEQVSVYQAGSGQSQSISTQEIDTILAEYTPEQLALVEMEAFNQQSEQRLLIHLPDQTLCYFNDASQKAGEPVWASLRSGVALDSAYPARHLVPCYGKWLVDAETKVGYLDGAVSTFFDESEAWQFQTNFVYNSGKNAIIHSLELVGLPGRTPLGDDPSIFFSWTRDGETWSQEQRISAGKTGERLERMVWRPHVRINNYMGLRFRGVGTSVSSFARLEATIEALS